MIKLFGMTIFKEFFNNLLEVHGMTFHAIQAVKSPRRLQAIVRSQLVETSFRHTERSKLFARRLWSGI